MNILPLDKKNILYAEKFLKKYEFTCVHLCSLVRKSDKSVLLVCKKEKIEKIEDIFGVFTYDGSMHHCLPDLSENCAQKQEFESVFLNFINNNKKKLKCINGVSNSTKIILSILEKVNKSPYQINKYDLMILAKEAENPPESLKNDDIIKRCILNDSESLFELQKQYLIDEVAPKGKKITDLEVSVILKQILNSQICVSLISDGEYAAKANTNAIGWDYVQLGGVYTNPVYRRNYYAWHLVAYLSNLLINKNKKVCLFVNEKNQPAHNLYKKAGYEQADKYLICYFY